MALCSFWATTKPAPPIQVEAAQTNALYTLRTLVTRNGHPSQLRFSVADDAPAIFLNHWRSLAAGDQDKLLAAMDREIAPIVAKEGNRGMALLTSEDRCELMVIDEWESVQAFEREIQADAAAQANRAKLTQWGEPFAGVYRVTAISIEGDER